MKRSFAPVVLGCLILGLPASARAQKPTGALSLKDGRFVFGKPIEQAKDGIIVKYDHGDVFVPERMIVDCFSSSPDFKFEPKNAKEKDKLSRGYVPFNGRWIKRTQADREIAKLTKKMLARLEERKQHKLWRKRQKVETRTFKWEHNLPPELFKDLQELFEGLYASLTKKWRRKTKLPNKPTIYLYADEGDYQQISGASAGILGFYQFVDNQMHVYWDRTDPELTIDVLFHEGTHMIVDMVNGAFKYQDWIEEGSAEYYGASHWTPTRGKRKRRGKMEYGGLQPGRLMVIKEAIRKDKWYKLEDLIKTRFGAYEYAWGWSFVHFMMHTPKYRKNWERFYLALAHGKGIKRVAQSYGELILKSVPADEQTRLLKKYLRVKDLKVLEKEWHAYVNKLQINGTEGYERAGRRLRTMGRTKQALEYLDKAIKDGAKSPFTYLAAAEIHSMYNRQAQALRMIDKAIEMDPLEAEFYYRKGKILARGGAAKNKEKAVKWLLLASEIEPDNWTYAAAAVEAEASR